MKWNVYIYNVNHQKIEVHNIFEHRGLQEEIKKIISEYTIKDEFAERLKSELRYYYKSRAEWEIIVAPWVGNKNPDEEKIDVYDQIMNNWHVFLEYCWNNMLELMKLGEEDEP